MHQQTSQLAKVQQRAFDLLGIQVMAGQFREGTEELTPLVFLQLKSAHNTLGNVRRGIFAHAIFYMINIGA